jgi:plasmid stabilization system protein ParE
MNIKFTPRAESEAEAKTRWWRRNREASPDLFDDELAEALAAIRREPSIGAVHRIDLGGTASPWPEAVMELGG